MRHRRRREILRDHGAVWAVPTITVDLRCSGEISSLSGALVQYQEEGRLTPYLRRWQVSCRIRPRRGKGAPGGGVAAEAWFRRGGGRAAGLPSSRPRTSGR